MKFRNLVDNTALLITRVLLNFDDYDELKRSHREWVEELLEEKENVRDRKWTESIAVGSKNFIEKAREKLGFRARGSKVNDAGDASFQLREVPSIYGDDSANIDIKYIPAGYIP